MERYCIFGDYNTLDWNLILTDLELTPSEPKTYLVDIDGVDGSIDLSESLSNGIVYKDRTFKATFLTDEGKRSDRAELLNTIRNCIHGRKLEIIEPDDLEHHLIGRIRITEETNNLSYATITVEAICEPYRYANDITIRKFTVSNSEPKTMIIINNGSKIITPSITVNGYVEMIFKDGTVSLSTGSYKVYDLKLYPGNNIIEITGKGFVALEYIEGYI